ncbi:hypothetical protein [Thermocatellispora tengchongensis]
MTNSTDRAQQQLAAGLALADLLTHAHRLPRSTPGVSRRTVP